MEISKIKITITMMVKKENRKNWAFGGISKFEIIFYFENSREFGEGIMEKSLQL